VPGRVHGADIALAARIVTLALDVELFYRVSGLAGVQALLRERAGGQYDPAIATLLQTQPALCAVLDAPSPWETVLAQEPGPRPQIAPAALDEALRAIADFVDLRLPMMSGHSTAVAALCTRAGALLGLAEHEVADLRRAAYVHDLGTASVSVSVWEKPGPLSADEWERVRLHPYYTERVLGRAPALAPLGRIAALHHEHLDGSGYYRQCLAPQLDRSARVLAAAEAYCGMCAPRAHRPALSPDQAAAELRQRVRAGRLDGAAVEAVLAAAGHRAAPRQAARPAGLSKREVEVLVLLARGLTNREIAEQIVIAPATVDHHIRHIYTKIGCSTRIAATLFAMEQHLLSGPAQR
jgi:DNA-binding CsgD family transcriptional regulator